MNMYNSYIQGVRIYKLNNDKKKKKYKYRI